MNGDQLQSIRAFVCDAAASDASLADRHRDVLAGLDSIGAERLEMARRLDEISEMLCSMARLDFSGRVGLEGDGGQVDGIVACVNMLSEELLERLEERKRTELELENRVAERTHEVTHANRRLQDSLDELRNTQRKLIEASRRAGMSDVATNVLHNVGNVLNSVNVATGVVTATLQSSRTRGLQHVSRLLREHAGDVGQFISADPVGRRLPDYLVQLAEAAEAERLQLVGELVSLQENVDHIKIIVSLQQSHARTSLGLVETISYAAVIDDALQLGGRDRGGP